GCTPPENLIGWLPKDAQRADILLLGCSDARHVLYTLWAYASECAEIASAGSNGAGLGSLPRPGSLRVLRFTLNDREPACMARVLLLLQMFLDSKETLVAACNTAASPQQLAAYAARIGVCFNAYYNVYVDHAVLDAVQ
ncbi:unnamed protein product, partial [Sphacelaria rigidula]